LRLARAKTGEGLSVMNVLIQLLPFLLILLMMIILLSLSAFFSGTETALFSLTRAQTRRMQHGSPGDRRATSLLRNPQSLLSTILVGNMFVNVLFASSVATPLRRSLPDWGVWVAIPLSTLCLLIFGEITPKAIAVYNGPLWARTAAVPLAMFHVVSWPVRIILRTICSVVLRLGGQGAMPSWRPLTVEEITAMVAVGQASGVTTDAERELVEHILELSNLEAHEIMVPRTEIKGIPDTLTLGEAYRVAHETRHSRLPIYGQNLDDIWGILLVIDEPKWRESDVMSKPLAELKDDVNAAGSDIVLPAYAAYVAPETAKVERLLAQMREQRTHFVVLVDEYGGTAGTLTLEDILAEIMGQIWSPAGATDSRITVDAGTVVVDGAVHLRDLNQVLVKNLPANGADSIGGHVTELLGHLPRAGDVVSDDWHEFRVLRMAGRRVGSIRITQTSADTADVPENQ